MNEFIADLIAFLETIVTRVYESLAEQDKVMPYAVITFPNGLAGTSDSNDKKQKFVEIDLYSKDFDKPTLETLADNIDKSKQVGLNNKCIEGAGYFANFFHEFRGNIPEPDNEIRRIQLRYRIEFGKRS